MTASTPTYVWQGIPNAGFKMYLIVLPTTAAPSYTVDLTGYLTTIYGEQLHGANGAAVASGTWSSLTYTIPSTAATGAKYLLIWGA